MQLRQSEGALTFGTPPPQGLPSVKSDVNFFFHNMFQWVFGGYHEKNDERHFEKRNRPQVWVSCFPKRLNPVWERHICSLITKEKIGASL
jgi:hypothetical protein